ncbi:MAG: MFS transporter, partial [Bacteroidetes bacterium CG_4_10_14_3_um_filter_42_6]
AMIFQYLKANGWTSQRVNYYGHTRSWSQVGSAFSALIAGVIVFFTGAIQQVFLWSVVPYLVNVVLIASYPKWLDGEIKSQQLIKIRLKFLSVWKAFVASMKERSTLTALISTSLFSGYYSAIKDYVQPMIKAMALAIPFAVYLNNDQKTAFLIGLVYFIIYLLTAAASRFSGRMTALFAHPYKPMNLTMIVG